MHVKNPMKSRRQSQRQTETEAFKNLGEEAEDNFMTLAEFIRFCRQRIKCSVSVDMLWDIANENYQ